MILYEYLKGVCNKNMEYCTSKILFPKQIALNSYNVHRLQSSNMFC